MTARGRHLRFQRSVSSTLLAISQTLFVSMQWPDVLLPSADMRSKEPSEWPTEERMKVLGEGPPLRKSHVPSAYVAYTYRLVRWLTCCLLNSSGRTIYYWPVLRHFLWRGKVNEQAETDGEEDGAREGARDLSQPQSVSAATPEVKAPKRKKSKKMLSREVDFSLSWPEVEAKVLKTVVASLDAGGVEGAVPQPAISVHAAHHHLSSLSLRPLSPRNRISFHPVFLTLPAAIASIETLYYILSQGNMGLGAPSSLLPSLLSLSVPVFSFSIFFR